MSEKSMDELNIRPLSRELQIIAIEELHEVPELVEDYIDALKTWLNCQPHLRARSDDQFLLGFLRGCKYNLEHAKSKIDKFYSLRSKHPDIFLTGFHDEERIFEVLRLGTIVYLPNPTNSGNRPRIGLLRQGICPADKCDIIDIIKVAQLMQEFMLMEDDNAIVNGIIHIVDFANVTTEHLFQMTPSVANSMCSWNEDAIPFRKKSIHIINLPMTMEPIIQMIKPMFSKKQQNRVFLHENSNIEHLYEHVPKSYLPKEYGGEDSTLAEIVEQWEQHFITYRKFFEENKNYGTDESLRPEIPIDYDKFGIEGTYRKLKLS